MNWITTKTGKHIPVPDDEEQKKRQIDYNQKQADKLNKKESQGKGKKQLSKKDELDNRFAKEKKGKK